MKSHSLDMPKYSFVYFVIYTCVYTVASFCFSGQVNLLIARTVDAVRVSF